MVAHCRVDLGHRVVALKHAVRQVHGNRVCKAEAVLPFARLACRLAQRPAAHLDDQPGLLGQRDKVTRRHQHIAALPTHQRFDADHARGAQVQLGLVVQHQLVAFDGLVQRALQRQLRAPLAGQRRPVRGGSVAAGSLHCIHGHVGIAHQVHDLGAVAREHGDADAGGHEALLVADEHRHAHRVDDARGHPFGFSFVGHLRQQRDELVAAQSPDGFKRWVGPRAGGFERGLDHLVGVAHAQAQAARHFEQQLVASHVAERVVDDLEAVQVDEQKCHAVAQAPRMLQCALAAPDQLAPVGQAGQRVKVGQVSDLVFGIAAVGHVLHDAAVAMQPSVLVELRLSLDVDDALPAVGQHHIHVGVQHRRVRQDLLEHAHQHAAVFLGCHAQQRAEGRVLVGAEAEHAQPLHRELRAALADAPVHTAHARQVLRACQARLAALELHLRARRAQQVAQSAGQQGPLRRLDEEVGRTGFVGAFDRSVVLEPGEHQHRDRRSTGHRAQPAADLKAIQIGHQRIEQDQIGHAVGQHIQRLLAAAGLGDRKAALAQRDGGEQQVHLIVVDKQHVRRAHGWTFMLRTLILAKRPRAASSWLVAGWRSRDTGASGPTARAVRQNANLDSRNLMTTGGPGP